MRVPLNARAGERATGTGALARMVPRLLGELARDTREHGLPIAVEVDADGGLRYGLTPEQQALVRTQLWQTAPPMYLLGVP
jgi:hypothetical protein